MNEPGVPPGQWRPREQGPAPLSASDERLAATLTHISVPFVWFVAPLIVWLLFRERSRFVADHSLEALNFSILYSIVASVGVITTALYIGILILLAAWVVAVIFAVLAALAANRGESYRYPLSLRLVK